MELQEGTEYADDIREVGASTFYLFLPRALREYLGINGKDKVKVRLDVGKHGRFVSFWKAEEKKKR